MKRLLPFVLSICIACVGCEASDPNERSDEELTYLGLETPGSVPEVFAPGLVSTDNLEVLPAMSPNLQEFYFLRQEGGSAPGYNVISFQNGDWIVDSVETTDGSGEVFISPDGSIMHLGAEFREKTADGWSDLKSLGAAFDKFEIMRLTASRDGTYVFDERKEDGLLRYSRLVDGQRETPVAFGPEINQGTFTAHPFIAEDESYLIFDSKREEGFGDSDLYISFRDDDGNWGPAINLGSQINTEFEDIFGSVTSDGEFFIYSTVNLEASSANIFWIDAAFIDALRPKIESGL
jgi:hypothetical protein